MQLCTKKNAKNSDTRNTVVMILKLEQRGFTSIRDMLTE